MARLTVFSMVLVLAVISFSIWWIWFACTHIGYARIGCPITEGQNFLFGIWHGGIMFYSLILKIFGYQVELYTPSVHTIWYEIGFFFGSGSTIFGLSKSSKKNP